ncbi:cytochrome C oxidase subunit IV family protein [Noviherbaspirillum denitrificans]|uniref:Cytochrome C oxidase subunit IV n=1 Tax=Noviherbaspirillum denitrificans TaxID=1968433 RepID=A0A254TCT5_9BURK|nr:cytochrome C oxidase subunit IV family protein [Noviherbaspirillum denitrificans]OWW20466.1 hypothetical protein AYR66_14190 [Noviherbaspirillum denitrificans]
MTNTVSICAWIALLALTALSVGFGETRLSGVVVFVPVLAATFIKGGIVIDAFMGLRRAPLMWRAIVFAWLALVIGLIAFAFRIS